MLPVFIISLPESTDRRARITKILADLNINFTFFDAVDGRQFNVLEQPIYDAPKRLRYFGKHMTGGDLGCMLSHKTLYQKMVNENIAQAIIFEDDIIIQDGFKEVLSEIQTMPVPFDMIRFLSSPKLERLKLRNVYRFKNGRYLVRHTGMPGGSHATLITLDGAKKMLNHLDKMPYAIDALMGRSWLTTINWYTVRTGLVAQDREIESMIGDETRFDNKKDITGHQKITFPFTRAWFKIRESLGKKYWYITTYWKDKHHGNIR